MFVTLAGESKEEARGYLEYNAKGIELAFMGESEFENFLFKVNNYTEEQEKALGELHDIQVYKWVAK